MSRSSVHCRSPLQKLRRNGCGDVGDKDGSVGSGGGGIGGDGGDGIALLHGNYIIGRLVTLNEMVTIYRDPINVNEGLLHVAVKFPDDRAVLI